MEKVTILKPLTILSIPPIAKGHEEIYKKFLDGRLIYRPDPKSDNGMIELRIGDLANPLEGTFDLLQCGDMEKYLSISTGYRKVKKTENAKKSEIWFVPRFLVEKEINGGAGNFKKIFPDKWPESALVGIFWTWGHWDNIDDWYRYVTEPQDTLGEKNICDLPFNTTIFGEFAMYGWMMQAEHKIEHFTICFGQDKPQIKDESVKTMREDGEQQRIEKQKVEERDKQEKALIWTCGIDEDIKYIKELQNDKLSSEDLLKLLTSLETYYTRYEQTRKISELFPGLSFNNLEKKIMASGLHLMWWLSNSTICVDTQYTHIISKHDGDMQSKHEGYVKFKETISALYNTLIDRSGLIQVT